MRAIFSKQFSKQRDRAPQTIKKALRRRLTLFLNEPFHPLLNNHILKGSFVGCRSINVTGDWRTIYQDIKDTSEQAAYFIALGTHSQLYKK